MEHQAKNKIGKIRAAIIGYGNIGKAVLQTLEAETDFEVAGIVRRSVDEHSQKTLAPYPVVSTIGELNRVDIAIICSPSRKVKETASALLQQGIHTVDSFDIHSEIVDLKTELDVLAKANNCSAIVSCGWDPGSDSILRALFQAMAPKGITYTNFGPGMSMGHTVAVKAISGVKNALSMTIPTGTGIHRRMVYVELEKGYSIEKVTQSIQADPYFIKDETHVKEVESVESLLDTGHGVHLTRKGVSGKTHNQLFEFTMTINNPALTAQVLVSSARACLRQKPGAYTLIEIPPVDLLPGDKESWIKKLV